MSVCTIEGCDKEHAALGLCAMHYYRLKKNGSPDVVKQHHSTEMSEFCEAVGCKKKAVAKGLCAAHYRRMRLYGDPNKVKQKQFHGLTLEERFWKYVVKTDGCWKWTACKDNRGYGHLMIKGVPHLATRLSWLIHNGSIPEKAFVLHRCDNPECTNPDHLFLGDQLDNVSDMWNKGRAKPGHMVGSKHGMAKLTEEQVREIRESKERGVKLAIRFGVARTTICDIRKRRIWTHIP